MEHHRSTLSRFAVDLFDSKHAKIPRRVSCEGRSIDFFENYLRGSNPRYMPVFEDDHLIVLPEYTHSAPLCYRIVFKVHAPQFHALPINVWLLACQLQREIRTVLRRRFNVELLCVFSEVVHTPSPDLVISMVSVDVTRLRHLKIEISSYQFCFDNLFASYRNDETWDDFVLSGVILRHELSLASVSHRLALLRSYSWDTVEREGDASVILCEPLGRYIQSSYDGFDLKDPVEIDDENDLPPLPTEMRYFVCIGGSKNYQAFVAPKTWSRASFMARYADRISPVLRDLYRHSDLFIRQDASRAIPGFYIVGPNSLSTSLDQMPNRLFLRAMFLMRFLDQLRSSESRVRNVNYYYDENYGKPVQVHFWSLPFYQEHSYTFVHGGSYRHLETWKYLEEFPFSIFRMAIEKTNGEVSEELQVRAIRRLDDSLSAYLVSCGI